MAATIGENSVVTVTGALTVTASSTTSTTSINNGGSGGLVAITVQLNTATHSADTTASLDGTSTVRAGSLSVTANAITPVTASVFTLGIGLAAGAGANVSATSSGAVVALVGSQTQPATPGSITVTGGVAITAGVEQTATTSNAGGAGGAVAVGAIVALAQVSGTSRAYIGDGTRLTAGSLAVLVRNTSGGGAVRTADSKTVVGSVGLLAGSGSGSTAVINGSLEAFIGTNATLTVSGATTISAQGTATATADAQGGAGALIAISVFFATACVSGYSVDGAQRATCSAPAAGTVGTRAYVGAGTTISTGSLQVEAAATDTATATLFALAIGLAAGTGGDANASVDSDVQSWLGTLTGASGTTITATGAVQVVATASQSATGTGQGGSGGVVTAAWLNATTSVSSAITALIGDGVTIRSAGTVQLQAETYNADATSNVTVGAGGGGVVEGVTVSATSNPTITAAVGDAVKIGSASPVAGDVGITSRGRAAADATGNAYAGGLLVIATPRATVTIDPAVEARVGTAAVKTTTIAAAGSILLTAQLTKGGTTPIDTITAVNLGTNTVTFSYPAVGEGTQVMYSANGRPVLGGLHDRNVYTLLDGGGTGQIRLGSLFEHHRCQRGEQHHQLHIRPWVSER